MFWQCSIQLWPLSMGLLLSLVKKRLMQIHNYYWSSIWGLYEDLRCQYLHLKPFLELLLASKLGNIGKFSNYTNQKKDWYYTHINNTFIILRKSNLSVLFFQDIPLVWGLLLLLYRWDLSNLDSFDSNLLPICQFYQQNREEV